MTIAAMDAMARIKRGYALILEAQTVLEQAGRDDIAALLYHALGELEDRFQLASVEDVEAMSASKKSSSRET